MYKMYLDNSQKLLYNAREKCEASLMSSVHQWIDRSSHPTTHKILLADQGISKDLRRRIKDAVRATKELTYCHPSLKSAVTHNAITGCGTLVLGYLSFGSESRAFRLISGAIAIGMAWCTIASGATFYCKQMTDVVKKTKRAVGGIVGGIAPKNNDFILVYYNELDKPFVMMVQRAIRHSRDAHWKKQLKFISIDIGTWEGMLAMPTRSLVKSRPQ